MTLVQGMFYDTTKTVTETQRLALEAKVPQVAKRSTCTLSHLINLRSELAVLMVRTQAWVVW